MKKSNKIILSTVVSTASAVAIATPILLTNQNITSKLDSQTELVANNSHWQPEIKDMTREINNYTTYPLANDKYIVVAKSDRVLVYALSGDLLYTLTTEFLTNSLGSSTNQITRMVLENDKLYILSSFIDVYNNPINTAFSVFEITTGSLKLSQYIGLSKNVVNNIMELSENEFLLTSSFNSAYDSLVGSDNLVFNKNDLSFKIKKFPKAVVNLDKSALLLDLVKVTQDSKTFLVGLVTTKTRGPGITYFSFDGELNDENPGDYSDYEIAASDQELPKTPLPVTSNSFEKNEANQKFVSPVFYNFQKEVIKSGGNNYVLFNFASQQLGDRLKGEISSGVISRNLLIFDVKNFVPNVSNGRAIPDSGTYGTGPESKRAAYQFTNYALAKNLKISDSSSRNIGFAFPSAIKTALATEESSNQGLVKASAAYAIKDDKIFTSILTPSKKLEPTIANKIFSTSFTPNTRLNMAETSYTNVANQFHQAQLLALPTKNAIVRVNDHYEDLIGLKLDSNNSTVTQTLKINPANKSVTFANFSGNKDQLPSQAQSTSLDNLITPNGSTTINSKEWIANDKDGTLILKANITTNVWYQDGNDTFDVYHVYDGFKKERDYTPKFVQDNSVSLEKNKLINKEYGFKNQLASNVSINELVENKIVIPPAALGTLNESNTTLTPNNTNGTLVITINENQVPDTLRASIKPKLTMTYTGFKKEINSNFYWKFNAAELTTYRSKKASELTVEQAKNLMSISGYDLNNGVVELTPNDALGIVNVVAKYTNLGNNQLTTFEAEFSNFKLPEVVENEDDAVISVSDANKTLTSNQNNFDLVFNLTSANAKYVQVEIIPWSTANNAPIANASILKSSVVLNNDNQPTTVSFSNLNTNFKEYKLLNVKFFDSQTSTKALSSPNFRTPNPQIILNLPQEEVVQTKLNVEEKNKQLKRTADGFKLNFNLSETLNNKFIVIELSELADDGVTLAEPNIKVNSGYIPSNNASFVFEDLKFDKKYKITNVGVYDEPNSLVASSNASISLSSDSLILQAPTTNDPIVNDDEPTNPTDNSSGGNDNSGTKPVDPNKPTDQTNPTDPTNPDTKPTDPTTPTDNNNSGNNNNSGTKPVDPNKPTDQTNPTDPTNPDTKPVDPNKPTNPDNNNTENNNNQSIDDGQNSKANKKDWITAVVIIPILIISLIAALGTYLKNKKDRKLK